MYVLITNNTGLYRSVKAGEYIEGSSLEVLTRVRSLVHSGSTVLTHPLCGNLRPYHQPFKSVIVDVKSGAVDLDSLSVIESAVNVYRSSPLIMPYELDDYKRGDYAYIDAELMRESLGHYGLIRDENLCNAPSLSVKEVN